MQKRKGGHARHKRGIILHKADETSEYSLPQIELCHDVQKTPRLLGRRTVTALAQHMVRVEISRRLRKDANKNTKMEPLHNKRLVIFEDIRGQTQMPYSVGRPREKGYSALRILVFKIWKAVGP